MIKLFRKIRQNLVIQNKFTKYILYAIGEIILVVIGILIALYINNQNEVRKNEAKFAAIFNDIQKDLSEDILDANNVFKRYMNRDSLKNLFFDGKLENGFGFVYRYVNFTIHNNGYNNLIRNSDNIPEKFTPLLGDLNDLYVERSKTIDVYNNRIQNTVYSSIDYLAKNKDWFTDWNYGIESPEIIQYFKTSGYFRNEVGLYMNDLNNLIRQTTGYRVKSIKLYEEIEDILGNEKPIPKHIAQTFPDLDVLAQFEGTYKWQEGLDEYKDELMIFKINNGSLFIGETDVEESEFIELFWFTDKTFFISSEIFKFETREGQVNLKINSFKGYEKWVKIN